MSHKDIYSYLLRVFWRGLKNAKYHPLQRSNAWFHGSDTLGVSSHSPAGLICVISQAYGN